MINFTSVGKLIPPKCQANKKLILQLPAKLHQNGRHLLIGRPFSYFSPMALYRSLPPNWATFDSNGPKFLTFSLINFLVLSYFTVLEYKKINSLDFLGFIKTKIGFFYLLLMVISLLSFFKSINVLESILHFGKIGTSFIATWIIASKIRKDKNILIYLIVGLTCLLIVDSLRVFWDIYKYITGEISDIKLIISGYSNKNILAAAIFIKLPFALYLVLFRST